MKLLTSLTVLALLVLASTAHASGAQPAGVSDIDWALSAAPRSIAAGAAVVSMSDDGKITELREGTNGWTCVVHDPGTPSGHPLCLDRNGLEWMQAAMFGREPDAAKTGYSYMLMGGTAWSNTDVSATKLASGQQDVVHVPPHIMIMNAQIANSSGFPAGETNPDTHKPFVIYGGTPFAMLIIPME